MTTDATSAPIAQDTRECDVVVLGTTLAGLVAAWQLSSVGLSVVVVDVTDGDSPESADGPGIGTGGTSGLDIPAGTLPAGTLPADTAPSETSPSRGPAEAAAQRLARQLDLSLSAAEDPDSELRECLAHLDLADAVHEYPAPQPALARPGSRPTPLNYANLLGIPCSPLDRRVGAVVGSGASVRAYLDRLMPVLTIGKEHYLGPMVRRRVGRAIADRVVSPLAIDRFGVPLDYLEVAAALPGVNEAVTRTGSLTGAVLAQHDEQVARETTYALRGGLGELAHRLTERIGFFSTPVIAGIPVSVERDAERVGLPWRVRLADDTELAARGVVVAAPLELNGDKEAEAGASSPDSGEIGELVIPGMVTGIAPTPAYAIFVIQCRAEVLGDLPDYVVAADPASDIRRIERVSRLWPESLSGADSGRETLRVVRTPQADHPSLTLLAGELSDLLGITIPTAALTQVDADTLPVPHQPAIILEPGSREAATTDANQPGLVRVPIWPVEGTLSDTIGLTRRAIVPLRRGLLGLT